MYHLLSAQLHQNAKMDWIQDGDKCTRLFYNSVKMRRKRNSMHLLLDSDGNNYASRDTITQHVLDYYGKLFGTTYGVEPVDLDDLDIGPKVTGVMNQSLIKSITAEEDRVAVFSMNDNKSPGPDGMNSCFYKKSWSIVGHELVVEAVQEFQVSGMLKQINSSAVTLIPKK